MKCLHKFILVSLLLCHAGITIHAQQPAFWNDIQIFKKQDSVNPPPKNAILFVGSSSFTKWEDVQDYFPGYTIINRGFGGSSLPDLIRYEKEVIFKYEPRQIVMYCGENDIAASDTVTALLVFERFKRLFMDTRSRFPGISFIYISMKPSPSRWQMKDRMIAGNELIKKYLDKQKNTKFVSVWKQMLGPDGKPRDELFIEDKLHMNAMGYAIWQKALKPYLRKENR